MFLNISVVDRSAATHQDLGALLNTAATHAATCEYPSGVLLREDWLPDGWEDLVEEADLAPVIRMTGMVGDELLPPRRPPAQVEVRRVADDATARDFAELNAHAYHMPSNTFECIANMRLWHADSYAYVGNVGGNPVSCGAALPVAGTVYIALVATLTEARGRGYAETVMRQAVTHGQKTTGTLCIGRWVTLPAPD